MLDLREPELKACRLDGNGKFRHFGTEVERRHEATITAWPTHADSVHSEIVAALQNTISKRELGARAEDLE